MIITKTSLSKIEHIPAKTGTYALEIMLPRPQTLQLKGAAFQLPMAHYIYFGSAFGSGGLHARLGRHIRGGSTKHWHIDHLRAFGEVTAFSYLEHPKRYPEVPLECRWAQAFVALPEAEIPIPGFGASDCHASCPAHLVMLSSPDIHKNFLSDERFLNILAAASDVPITEVKLGEILPKNSPDKGVFN